MTSKCNNTDILLTMTCEEYDNFMVWRFPLLYSDRYASMMNTCLCWGFEIGLGWRRLVYDLSCKLEPLIEAYVRQYPIPVVRFRRAKTRWNDLVRRVGRKIGFRVVGKLFIDIPESHHPRASQVKEKYAGLRFYMTAASDEMYALISAAEKLSLATCEQCGKPGKVRGTSWLYCRCLKCWKAKDIVTE